MTPEDEAKVLVLERHAREEKLCARGQRAWFQGVGLNWNVFITRGLTVAELRAPGCVLAEGTIRRAIAEAQRGRQI